MPKYKWVKVPIMKNGKRTGRTRRQKAQVLKSGKLKFVKNTSKSKTSKPKKSKKSKSTKSASKSSRRGTNRGSRSRSSRASRNPGGGHTGKNKLPSLSKNITAVGAGVAVTGIGTAAVDRLVGEINDFAQTVGLGITITGVGIVVFVNAMALTSSKSWLGKKWRVFCNRWGFSP